MLIVLLRGLRSRLGPKDKLFTHLLLFAPSVPEPALCVVRDFCGVNWETPAQRKQRKEASEAAAAAAALAAEHGGASEKKAAAAAAKALQAASRPPTLSPQTLWELIRTRPRCRDRCLWDALVCSVHVDAAVRLLRGEGGQGRGGGLGRRGGGRKSRGRGRS